MCFGCHSVVILDTILMCLTDITIMSFICLVLDLEIQNGGCVIIGKFSKNIYGAASKILEFWRGITFIEVYIKFIHKKHNCM